MISILRAVLAIFSAIFGALTYGILLMFTSVGTTIAANTSSFPTIGPAVWIWPACMAGLSALITFDFLSRRVDLSRFDRIVPKRRGHHRGDPLRGGDE